ncbi:BMP-binding endothelial regulator protein isoform X2 [Hydra vulgaris]|uniref:BMP-binding endothelial regulator protein isoform X2 n=1 Tax=Hydra vulgaris TaxID=6087 RepID=A0ABM4CT73_HYDVU
MCFKNWGIFFVLSSQVFQVYTNIVEEVTIPPSDPCKNIFCPSTSHCHSVVNLPNECCPRCGCTDTADTRYALGEKFIIDRRNSCSNCECKGILNSKYAVCKIVKCPTLNCPGADIYKQAGQCCPTCKKASNPSYFPEIPDFMKKLG